MTTMDGGGYIGDNKIQILEHSYDDFNIITMSRIKKNIYTYQKMCNHSLVCISCSKFAIALCNNLFANCNKIP